MSNDTYTLEIAGLKRKLKKFPVSDKMDIAAFIMFGDVELTEKCAEALLEKAPEFDYILTPEAKRKSVKVYMDNPVEVIDQSLTTQAKQSLYLGHEDGDQMHGKRVLIVDDVISTGGSMKASCEVANAFGAEIVGCCAPLAEGDAADRDDIFFLQKLPLFFK